MTSPVSKKVPRTIAILGSHTMIALARVPLLRVGQYGPIRLKWQW